jgi:exodeoxyribonuclease V alpha subunit
MDELITITGSIINYIYTSNDSLYKVCKLLTLDEDEIVIVGSFPRLEEGLNYEFRGYMKEHQKYGEQFVVSSYTIQIFWLELLVPITYVKSNETVYVLFDNSGT